MNDRNQKRRTVLFEKPAMFYMSPRFVGENWHEWNQRTGEDYPLEFKDRCLHISHYIEDGIWYCVICGTPKR